MDNCTRKILADNLRALMGASERLNTFAKITAAGGPTNGTLDRIRRAEAGCSIDQLDLLAKVFGVEMWQLLVPGLKPQSPPELMGGSEMEKAMWARIDALRDENAQLRAAQETPKKSKRAG